MMIILQTSLQTAENVVGQKDLIQEVLFQTSSGILYRENPQKIRKNAPWDLMEFS